MRKYLIISLLLIVLLSCVRFPFLGSTPTPLPGWRQPVYQLLLEDGDFPEGWLNEYPELTEKDPTINYVSRIWGRKTLPGTVEQAVMRAYSIENAKNAYQEKQSQFTPTPSPFDNVFIPLEPPIEVHFVSQISDEWHFACGWITIPYCLLTARYRNYVTEIKFPLEVEHIEYQGWFTDGLTYEEIEELLQRVDAKFSDFLQENPLQ